MDRCAVFVFALVLLMLINLQVGSGFLRLGHRKKGASQTGTQMGKNSPDLATISATAPPGGTASVTITNPLHGEHGHGSSQSSYGRSSPSHGHSTSNDHGHGGYLSSGYYSSHPISSHHDDGYGSSYQGQGYSGSSGSNHAHPGSHVYYPSSGYQDAYHETIKHNHPTPYSDGYGYGHGSQYAQPYLAQPVHGAYNPVAVH